MILSDISVKRPIAMTCFFIIFTLLGIRSYFKLGLETMPKLDVPFVTIVTVYPGASPEEIEIDVGKRIEDALMVQSGLKHIETIAMDNVCMTLLEFNLDVDVDIATTELREKINDIIDDLPAGVESPKINKFDINSVAVITLALTGDHEIDALYDFADNKLNDELSRIPGVASVTLVGGAERQLHIKLDQQKVISRGLNSLKVMQQISNAIGTMPCGRIKGTEQEFSVKYDANAASVDEMNELELVNDEGKRICLKDIGSAEMTTEEIRQSASFNGKNAIKIDVVKKSEANAVAVAEAVKKAAVNLADDLPGGMNLSVFSDDSIFIRSMNFSAWENVIEGIFLTAMILFLFLYNVRALFVVALTMPLTIIIGLFFMDICNFSLNTSTLIAIGMSVGILVTNSIVVLEAIITELNRSKDPKQAAMTGAKRSFLPVLASAATNIVVLFPLAVMGSMVGMFISPLAVTMLIMTAVSLFISFSLTPLMCSVLLKPTNSGSRSFLVRIEKKWNQGFDIFTEIYRKILESFEKNRTISAIFVIAIIIMFFHAMSLAKDVGFNMVQDPDKGSLLVKMEFPTYYSIENTNKKLLEAEKILTTLPHIKNVLTSSGKVESMGGAASEGVYLAQIQLMFDQRTERKETIFDLQKKAAELMSDFTDAIITVSIPGIIGGQKIGVELEVYGDNMNVLDDIVAQVQLEASKNPKILTPDTSARMGKPEMKIRPKRKIMSDNEILSSSFGATLRGNLDGLNAGTFKNNARNYDIVVKYNDDKNMDQVEKFMYPGDNDHPINISSLASIERKYSPIQIQRRSKKRRAMFICNFTSDLPLDQAVAYIEDILVNKVKLPAGYTYSFEGDYAMMGEAQAAFGEALIIALILVILTMSAIMESFKQPFLIFVTVPLALIGMMWALWLTGEIISIFVIMGFIMMVGIVVNNAILIMDQFNIHIDEGISRHKAMITASCEKIRPIVMITFAAVLGMMPLAIGRGIGAELRNGVGVASVGGILVSGILSLFLLPILYDLFTSKNGKRQIAEAE